ncbi:hypothetical protein Dsin_029425 [Dipteronia sinensis]|uniref:RING-type E3 ubiquitin transferase n=1 Tax=Dipteronia sinensis TaxID=43782 RepID=A0AAE0DVJ5_9ROSI|nr:hypothetical protein Dsin_029425 [Dipteronia sinensis]
MKYGNRRFELRNVELVDDQSLVPEEFKNMARGFCFIVQFYYTTEFEYSHRSLESLANVLQCQHFHIQFPQIYTRDEDSLLSKLLASFLTNEDLPDDVQKTMASIIVDVTKSIVCSTPNTGHKVEPILVQFGIVNVISMKENSLFTHVIEEGSLKGEQCVICLEEFSSGELEIVLMPCSHVYHRNCITKWLQTTLHCPTCWLRLAQEPSD